MTAVLSPVQTTPNPFVVHRFSTYKDYAAALSENDVTSSDICIIDELPKVDFDFTANTPITHSSASTVETVTFATKTQGTQWINASADLDMNIACNNDSSNYIIVSNTGSSGIDVAINSMTNNGSTVTAVVVGGAISVAANKKCEIGILKYLSATNTYTYIITHVEI